MKLIKYFFIYLLIFPHLVFADSNCVELFDKIFIDTSSSSPYFDVENFILRNDLLNEVQVEAIKREIEQLSILSKRRKRDIFLFKSLDQLGRGEKRKLFEQFLIERFEKKFALLRAQIDSQSFPMNVKAYFGLDKIFNVPFGDEIELKNIELLFQQIHEDLKKADLALLSERFVLLLDIARRQRGISITEEQLKIFAMKRDVLTRLGHAFIPNR